MEGREAGREAENERERVLNVNEPTEALGDDHSFERTNE